MDCTKHPFLLFTETWPFWEWKDSQLFPGIAYRFVVGHFFLQLWLMSSETSCQLEFLHIFLYRWPWPFPSMSDHISLLTCASGVRLLLFRRRSTSRRQRNLFLQWRPASSVEKTFRSFQRAFVTYLSSTNTGSKLKKYGHCMC